MATDVRAVRLSLSAAVTVSLAISMLATGAIANAAGPPTVGLGTAGSFAVLAGTPAVTNTGPTTITGDMGIAPADAVTGFPPGTVDGEIHKADAVAVQAKSDLVVAYDDAAGRPVTATQGTLGGLTLVGGVYNAGGVVLDLTGTLTLDGQDDPNSVWIFQATSSLVTASSSRVELINGASSCNVFWQVTSSATLGSDSTFVGTIMALTSITMDSGVTVDGRALARNGDVTLINDTISTEACSASSPNPTPKPTPKPAAGASLPPTDTLPTTGGSGSGTTPAILLFGFFVLAFVVAAGNRSLRAIRTR